MNDKLLAEEVRAVFEQAWDVATLIEFPSRSTLTKDIQQKYGDRVSQIVIDAMPVEESLKTDRFKERFLQQAVDLMLNTFGKKGISSDQRYKEGFEEGYEEALDRVEDALGAAKKRLLL